jgi:hypothetical protein
LEFNLQSLELPLLARAVVVAHEAEQIEQVLVRVLAVLAVAALVEEI